MPDTPRSLAYLIGTSFVAGQVEGIGSDDFRDFVSSVPIGLTLQASSSYADDTAAAAGGVPIGGYYRNGNFVMVRLT